MARRPTPNPRRGILRAAITVVVLSALLILAILVVSSLSAPSAKAPTTPPSPGPITPVTAPTASTPGTTRATATPGAVPSPTNKKKTLGSLLSGPAHVTALERSPSISLLRRAAYQNAGGIEVREKGHLAWFTATGEGPAAARIWIRSLPAGKALKVGSADSSVKPIWSSDGRLLLYVRSTQSRSYPGVRWTLMQYDSQTRMPTTVASLSGYRITPLGWWHSRPLFLAATATDTSLYTASGGRPHFLTVLAPQVITSAALSPSASTVAFAAPTNCYNCTLEFFDLRTSMEWNGPSGIARESQFAWSQDGRSVVTVVHDRVAVVSASVRGRLRFGRSVQVPLLWQHSMRVSTQPYGVHLVDTVTGRSIFSPLPFGAL